ncbi:hypothetical protein KCV07_g1863, partial [Aureobasidium melanogenum]
MSKHSWRRRTLPGTQTAKDGKTVVKLRTLTARGRASTTTEKTPAKAASKNPSNKAKGTSASKNFIPEGDDEDGEESGLLHEPTEDDMKDIPGEREGAASSRFSWVLNSLLTGSTADNGYACDGDELNDSELDDDEYGEDPEEMWNLRKCSAVALDTFATRLHERVFEFTLLYLKHNLNHAEWPKERTP